MLQIYIRLVFITPQNEDDFHDSIHIQYDTNHYHEKLIEWKKLASLRKSFATIAL